MKTFKLILLFVFVSLCYSANSQNNAPVISNLSAVADTVLHKLTVTYNLADAENDDIEIFLSASADSGFSYPFNTSNATGDIGYPVIQGSAKQIVWYYPDSLSYMVPRYYIKLTADDRVAFDIQQIVNQIDSNRLQQNLQFIEGIRHRVTGPAHLYEVRDSIFARFQQYGLQARGFDFPYDSNYTGKDVIGRKPGAAHDKRTFILSGHYDTVNDSPGADDNGSAISAIMEVLRVLSPLNCANTLEFIGFDLEEAGLRGSIAYVPNGIKSYEDIGGVINMDMISYYSEVPNSQIVPSGFDLVFPDLYNRLVADSFRGNFIISTANDSSVAMLSLFDTMATRYVPDLLVGSITVPGNGTLIPDSRRSDHAAFWDAGYQALHISDGAETRNPNYHDPTDVISTVNYTFMSRVTRAVTATLLSLIQPLHADVETVHVTADPASAIWEMEEDGCKLMITPNPSDGHFRILIENCRGESMKFRMLSLDGKIVWQSNLETGKEMSTGNFETGYYIIEISNSKHIQSKKIFVK